MSPVGAAGDRELADAGSGRHWPGVEFRHLGALAAVAREGSFRRAAESLGYVQSAISGQIAQLERAVGTRLVERHTGREGATLTAAGEVLLQHVGGILARFEAARMDLQAVAEGREGALRVGAIAGTGRRLAGILKAFAKEFPSITLSMVETEGDEESFGLLARGELDLMIAELPLPDGPFDHSFLASDSYVLLVPGDSHLAGRAEPPTPDLLSRLPLLVAAPARRQAELADTLRDAGIEWKPWLRAESLTAMQAFVEAGLGVALVPRLAVDHGGASTAIVELPGLLPERQIVLASHREREYSVAVRRFAELTVNMFGTANGHVERNGSEQ